MSSSRRVTAAAIVIMIPVLAGCSAGTPQSADDRALSIVASTDVWGDIAAAVAGDRAQVTSIIDSPNKDPHEYEASARDQLALSRADIVIENGGGYDEFVHTMLDASGSDPVVINAVALSDLPGAPEDEHGHEHVEGEAHAEGDTHTEDEHAAEEHAEGDEHAEDEHDHGHSHDHGGFNEHVWYDVHTAEAVAAAVAASLTEIDPDGEADYTANLESFEEGLAPLEEQMAAIAESATGRQFLVTEPVPLWLLSEMGLEDVTPESLPQAVEEDSDVAPAVLQETIDLLGSGDIAFLAYNEQASTSQTEQLLTAAESAGVAVLDFTETLPDGQDYIGWMTANVTSVGDALGV